MSGTPARARSDVPSVAERVQIIAGMMARGEWTTATHIELAELWGVDASTVRRSSAEASRLVRAIVEIDPETVRLQCLTRLDAAFGVAAKQRDASGMVKSTLALAKMIGVDVAKAEERPGDGARVVDAAPALTLESLLRGPGDIATPSPAQLGIVRAADGLPTGLTAEQETPLFGAPRVPAKPERVLIVAGVRGGKSRMAACAAVYAALTADISQASEFEEVRVLVLAPRKVLAKLTFAQVLGVLRHASLSDRIVGEPTADTVRVRRDDGREVSIVIAAASAYGTTVRSSWLAGLLLDEAAFFGDGDDGYAVNVADIVGAAETRLLGQMWVITSPNGPRGWVRETFTATTGKGGDWLTVHAPTRSLNPAYPQAKIDKLRERDSDAAAREFDAAWIDADHQWLPSEWIARATYAEQSRPRLPGARYVATMDPAFRGNAWTLLVGCVDADGKIAVHAAREWVGSRESPLKAADVFREAAEVVSVYDCAHSIYSDQASFDALLEHAQGAGLSLIERAWTAGSERTAIYEHMRTLFGDGRVALPDVPNIARDLGNVRRRLTAGGSAITLPETPDKRHCDFAPALAMLCDRLRYDGSPEPAKTPDDEEDELFDEPPPRWPR